MGATSAVRSVIFRLPGAMWLAPATGGKMAAEAMAWAAMRCARTRGDLVARFARQGTEWQLTELTPSRSPSTPARRGCTSRAASG